mmetsp:Transcript_135929/g.344166  ORF Transcript_135929/g.344166 Transcript_135929/m.344166 type:complete len:302 (+) Transcript_135929:280-1185(+)
MLCTPHPFRNTHSAAALVSGTAQRPAARWAAAARAAWLTWEALPTARDEIISAGLGATCACCHARAITALVANGANHTRARGAGATEAIVLCARQALATTGDETGTTPSFTLGCTARAIRSTHSVAALGMRGADHAGSSLAIEAALVLRGPIHALPSTVNHAFSTLFGTPLSIWQADAIAALRSPLTDDAVACGADAALVCLIANDANSAARGHAWAAILRTPSSHSHAHSIAALVPRTAQDFCAICSPAARAPLYRRKTLSTTSDQTFCTLICQCCTAIPMRNASATAALPIKFAHDALS